MRAILCAALLAFPILAGAQDVPLTAAAQAEAHSWQPGASTFYLNGIAYRFSAGPEYTVVAAAAPGIAGKYLGLKIHIFNRSRQSVTIRPEEMIVTDAIGARKLASIPAGDIVSRKRGQPAWMRVAGTAIGGAPDGPPVSDIINPQWSDLVRALHPQVNATANAPADRREMLVEGPDCDTVCQLRNREVISTLSSGWQPQNLEESIERTALLANTIPPNSDVEGVLYFPMPRQASTDAAHRKHTKNYAITILVPVGDQRFSLDFPVE